MPSGVNLGNIDKECTEASTSSARTLSCTVPAVAAGSTKILDFFVDGPKSKTVGNSFQIAVTTSSIPVTQPDAITAGLADGDSRVSGSSLTIQLLRDIDIDFNRNGVPDIDEAIMQMPIGTPIEELLARTAVVDVLFIYTPAAAAYLGGKLGRRVAQIVTATNQTFRENNVAIKFNGTGLAAVPYATTNVTLANLLSSIQANSVSAFAMLDQMIAGSGGDMVVVLHALDPSTDTFCGLGALNAVGRQGDFRAVQHRGEMLSVINGGPDCLGRMDISPLLATNMGIVSSRLAAPDGGTFSYSAGYGVTDLFVTATAQPGANLFGQAEILNRFSNPLTFCKSVACGVDRNNIAQGADAVYSLNKTRHLVSAITPSAFPAAPESLPNRTTVSASLNYDLEIVQTPVDSVALFGEFTEIQVSITNVSGEMLENMDISFEHLAGGLVSNETQVYEISDPACRILGSNQTSVGIQIGNAEQKPGTLTCFIDALAPGAGLAFNYRIQIDNTPPNLNGAGYYHEMVTVNGMAQLESAMCLPVFANFILANIGSTVCDSVLGRVPGVAPTVPLDLNARPSITGTIIALPFLRLWDGGLISAELRITLNGPLALEIVSYADLDPALQPAFVADYDQTGVLRINNL